MALNDPNGDCPGCYPLWERGTVYDPTRDTEGGAYGYGGRIGIGSGNHWSDAFRSQSGDYFVMSNSAFEQKYGQSVRDYRFNMILEEAHRTGDAITLTNVQLREVYNNTWISTGDGNMAQMLGPISYEVVGDQQSGGTDPLCTTCTDQQNATVIPLPLAAPLLESVGLGAIAELIDQTLTATDQNLAHGVQYSLRAQKAGYYPTYEWGKKNPTRLVWLEWNEVWKFGETTRVNLATLKQYRYSETWLKSMNLDFVPEYTGNVFQIKTIQNLKVLQYSISNLNLPPGNKGVQ
ncbi:MAG: hypothetical protein AAGA64_15130 [Bacteroidota bacterium]